ncbi:MAG: hypothetical protein ACRDP6_02680 [Actinoallomurus sp.]
MSLFLHLLWIVPAYLAGFALSAQVFRLKSFKDVGLRFNGELDPSFVLGWMLLWYLMLPVFLLQVLALKLARHLDKVIP